MPVIDTLASLYINYQLRGWMDGCHGTLTTKKNRCSWAVQLFIIQKLREYHRPQLSDDVLERVRKLPWVWNCATVCEECRDKDFLKLRGNFCRQLCIGLAGCSTKYRWLDIKLVISITGDLKQCLCQYHD